jgi:excisionase family DNA binding protein
MAAARPETTGRKPRGQSQGEQTEPTPPAPERLVYTVLEAGRLLGLSRNGSYEAAKRGDIPTIRIGRLLLVPKVPFHRLIESQGYGHRGAGQGECFQDISTMGGPGCRRGEGEGGT